MFLDSFHTIHSHIAPADRYRVSTAINHERRNDLKSEEAR